MSNLRVLVVGASVAGPTTAYWLAKTGATVTVIERFPYLRPGGQNIDIRTSGVTVMRRMQGMEAAVRANMLDMEGIALIRKDGRPYAIMGATGDPDAQSLLSEYEIYRGHLARVLYDLSKDNDKVNYVFGEQVKAIQHQDDNGPVTVEFANGILPPTEFDLVVACDGSTSRTRAIGFGCGVRDHITSLKSWAAYFTIDKDILNRSKIGNGYSATGGRFVATSADPAGGTKVVLQGVMPRNTPGDVTLPFREAVKKGEDAIKSYIYERFLDAGWKSDEIMAGMMESKDFYASELVQVKIPSLSRGRFVVVGDAGYACGPTGFGTSLALTGAYVLAGEIGKHKGDIAAGLKAYEERMNPIIEEMQKIPPGIPGIMAPQTWWGIWLRNMIFVLIVWTMKLKPLFAWLSSTFASSFGGDKFDIPDYKWEQ
ncbi:hypothetical protein BD289DRAFT_440931 [Coniella lustricola]|uniref:FAD-binding domain-containing protein n=1 Tax=Coniella lustricola TaxID=2025994 RepID=A0A2T3A022_9PEZI|nr:hypothetical protein BD289DRAFT_440931 [Coniella lustricola]